MNGANPYSGSIGKLSFADEVRIECVVSQNDLEKLVREVVKKHPYEEPAYDIYKIENRLSQAGIGRSGEVDPPVRFEGFIETIKEKLGIGNIRWMASDRESTDKSITGKTIRKVAVINGSAGSFSERFFKSTENQYDMIITGEIKHHSAIKLIESGIILVELGHAESEKFFTELVFARLSAGLKKFEKFKLIKGKTGFIPWRYCIE